MADSDLAGDSGFISLAMLAQSSTDDVITLLSRTPDAGIYRVKGLSVAGKQGEPVEGKPPLSRFNFKYKILSAKLVDKSIDAERLVDRPLNDSYALWPQDLQAMIGLLKGRYQKIGLPNSGMPLGGVENLPPGWLDGIVGHEFDLKVRTAVVNGETRAYYDYLTPEQAKAA